MVPNAMQFEYFTNRLAVEADLWNKKLGLLGIWGGLIREWLDEILPEDADQTSRSSFVIPSTAYVFSQAALTICETAE